MGNCENKRQKIKIKGEYWHVCGASFNLYNVVILSTGKTIVLILFVQALKMVYHLQFGLSVTGG